MTQKTKFLQRIVPGFTAGFLLCLIFSSPAQSQPKPLVVLQESELNNQDFYDAWVEFKDKGIRTKKQRQKILKELEENFNSRALERRKAKRTLPGLFDERDFPLSKIYLNGVAKTGVVVKIQSRWRRWPNRQIDLIKTMN